MSAKQIRWLVLVLGLLIAAAVIKRLIPRKELFRQEAQSLQIQVHPETVNKITIVKGENASVELQNMEGIWRLPSVWNARADADRVRQLLEHLSELSGEARGNSETLFDDFGISDAKALHITLFEGDREALHLLVGTAPAGWQQAFVREAGSPNVFLTRSQILQDLNIFGDIATAPLSTDTWLQLKLLTFSPEEIQRIEVREGSGEWRELGNPLPFERDDEKVRAYLQTLLTLKAGGVVDPQGTAYGFDQPTWQLRLNKKEGDPILLSVGGAKTGSTDEHDLRLSTSSEVYYAGRYMLEQLQADGSRLIRPDPLKIGAAAWRQLKVKTMINEVALSLKDAHWQGLDDYLQALNTFQVAQTDHLPAREGDTVTMPYWIELTDDRDREKTGIACEAPGSDPNSHVLCLNQHNGIRFLITHAMFQSLFEQLERLEKPQPPAQPAAQDLPAASSSSPPSPTVQPPAAPQPTPSPTNSSSH